MAKVLIVEDDVLISDLIEDALSGSGYDVCGIATTAAEAIAIGERERPDLAVVDVRLADGSDGTVAAARLMSAFTLGVLYATGNTDHLLSSNAAGHAYLKKPYRPSDVVRALKIIEHIINGNTPTERAPPGLTMLQRQSMVTGGG
jgi:DNA-binding response OmpR family regulator